MDLRDLYQDIILDHARNPRNCGSLSGATHLARGHNPLCGDRVTVFLRIAGDRIIEVRFEGRGCAISIASASLMTEVLTGKSLSEAQALFGAFHAKVTTGESIEVAGELNEDAERLDPLTGVRAYPARVKCATLAWHALDAAVKGGLVCDLVKTE